MASSLQEHIYKEKIKIDTIICGDCLDVLKEYPNNCVDLIFTSPPYADRRQHTYGGISPDNYTDWFITRSAEFLRVLKPSGSFILNIKEHAEAGERSTYVIELILALKKQGWVWTEEYIWHKKNCHPGKWPNRFRDAWERLLQFNKTKQFKMNQESVKIPIGEWHKKRLQNLSDTDMIRDESKSESGFGKRIANWVGKELVYPTNVLHLATECFNRNHSATFPISLPEWFIKLFSDYGDIVLDPFIGSGTTAVAANNLDRHYIGIEILPKFCELADTRLKEVRKESLWNTLP